MLKQILQETQQQASRGQNGRHSEIKYRDHPAMAQRFRQGTTTTMGNYQQLQSNNLHMQLEALNSDSTDKY